MKLTFLKYISFICLSINSLLAQDDTTNNFLPHSLGTNVNTSTNEINPVLSYDGKTLYFSREDSSKNSYWHVRPQYIYQSKLQKDNTWGPAVKLPDNVNAGLYNAVVGVSKGGDTLYISGHFTKKSNRWFKRGLSTVARIDSNNWANPERFYVRGLPRMNKGTYSNMSVSKYENVLFISMSKRLGSSNNNIYRCAKYEDFYWRPRKLKKPIRHYKGDEAPFLTADGKTLYFSSNRKSGDKNAKRQIYKTTPLDTKLLRWTEPVALSDTINSAVWDSYFITNTKGSWAYFCSKNKSTGGSDIFRIKLFEENPFVLVNGVVASLKNGVEEIPNGKINVYNNGTLVDTLKINSDGTFKLLLPLGASYTLKADMKNYESVNEEVVDASKLREYKEVRRKLLIKPSNALINGKIATSENKLIEASQEPKFFINDKELTAETAKEFGIDTFNVDFAKGTYMFKAPLKKKYKIEIKAKETNPIPATVDLSNVSDYKEVSKDVFVAPIKKEAPKPVEAPKVATMTGRIINKKTSKPLIGKEFVIQINEQDLSGVKVDSSKGTYEFTSDLGKKFIMNAKVPNYYPEFDMVDLTNEKTNVKMVRDLYVSPIEVGQSIKLKNIFFDFGKSTLKKESFPELDKLFKFLSDNPDIKVEIAGHTDNKGKADKNLQLSRWRARSVQQYIVQKGIDISRIKFNGYGMTKPVADNKTEKGRALNRRVEFTILDK